MIEAEVEDTGYRLPLLPDEFYEALVEAGVLAEGNLCKSVVITLKPREVVSISVELEADHRLLSLIPHLPREPE